MSKKKHPPKKRGTGKSQKTPSEPLPDRRAMDKMMADLGRLLEEQEFDSIDDINAYLQQLMASGEPIPSSALRTPLEKTQELMYEAWEATGKRRVKLASEALAISEDCADAYVLLAEEATKTLEEARDLYAAGVKAGERALGKKLFEEAVGHFWGILETRPYMRARAGLAGCLWQLGQRQEAISHYEEMLRLNPGDNQGIRYTLLNCYLEEGLGPETKQLLAEYEDDGTAAWLYNQALFLFQQQNASKKAKAQIHKALRQNPHVPAYLLRRKRIPKRLPPYVGFGDQNEAVYDAAEAGHLWSQQEGALDWLLRVSQES
jgi:tetratricopeptide (TPR) repeat protein